MLEAKRGRCRIGTSGYQYEHWRGPFYPIDLPRARWFAYYAAHFDAVEINNTFYRLPEARVFERWRASAPRGFCFALKFSRFATHYKHLRDPGDAVALFAQRARLLGRNLGPVLVQLPPRWAPNLARLDAFLAVLPRDLRWAIEFRDRRWLTRATYQLLAERGAALCVHDLIARHPRIDGADFAYFRFHGDPERGDYSPQFLAARAREIGRLLRGGRDVYAFFNNDAHAYAVANGSSLSRYLARVIGPTPAGAPDS